MTKVFDGNVGNYLHDACEGKHANEPHEAACEICRYRPIVFFLTAPPRAISGAAEISVGIGFLIKRDPGEGLPGSLTTLGDAL
jgi:hypothetical protein